MNNQSPLIPQGSIAEQKNKGRARVKIAVFFVLAIHGIGLMALLVQGCQKDKEAANQTAEQTNNPAPPAFAESTNPPAASSVAEAPAAQPTQVPVTPTVMTETHAAAPLPGTGAEYTIAPRDNFSTVAKKFGVTTKAIAEANPGVEPTKLKIGQKIHVPAPVAAPASTVAAGAPAVEATSGEKLYTVQSGDSLIKIAHNSGTQVKAIRALNNLKSDSIRVGQKLKLPVKNTTSTAALTAAENAPMVSSASPTTAPLGR